MRRGPGIRACAADSVAAATIAETASGPGWRRVATLHARSSFRTGAGSRFVGTGSATIEAATLGDAAFAVATFERGIDVHRTVLPTADR
jgi:hypothetical protein